MASTLAAVATLAKETQASWKQQTSAVSPSRESNTTTITCLKLLWHIDQHLLSVTPDGDLHSTSAPPPIRIDIQCQSVCQKKKSNFGNVCSGKEGFLTLCGLVVLLLSRLHWAEEMEEMFAHTARPGWRLLPSSILGLVRCCCNPLQTHTSILGLC
ncbi:hypothetical protein EYF80_007716 [Liparis tanakae]|uniref:Uncharacterized protein n=1 Tax=Liparis tanakae TaxID=230148 RepID=A0A4Z2IVT8_9TELE|nr:hypothetical protein EYF80_007716 [Liparis tanakae]